MNSHPIEMADIESRIYLIRGQKVMLDAALAALYGVETKALVQAVKRNLARFPDDFMFQLTSRCSFIHVRSCVVAQGRPLRLKAAFERRLG